MSEEKKEQSTTSESGLDQISLDDENKMCIRDRSRREI